MSFEAAILDLDGVVTRTARVHAAAWKQLFDDYLRSRAARLGEPFRPFDDADYRALVDGRSRYEGVRAFLEARRIALPRGEPGDPPERETICGLGNRKDVLFHRLLDARGVDVFSDAVAFVRALRDRGLRVGVATSSKNGALVLARAGLADLFEARVDGVVSERLGLASKPRPDLFLACLRALGCRDPARAILVEDSVVGVEAGRAGGFGLVVGVARAGADPEPLRGAGADRVVRTLAELSVEALARAA